MIGNVLDIKQTTLDSYLTFTAPISLGIPYPELTISNLDGTLLLGPLTPKIELNQYIWTLPIGTANGFIEQTHYVVDIFRDETPEYDDSYIIYINAEQTFISVLTRIAGLSGQNLRRYDYTYLRGNVSQYKIAIYSTKTLLDQAVAGGIDSPIARYQVTCRYDYKFNRYETMSIRTL